MIVRNNKEQIFMFAQELLIGDKIRKLLQFQIIF